MPGVPAIAASVAPADSAVAGQLFDRLIESLLRGSQPWEPIESRIPGTGTATLRNPGPAQGTLIIVRDALPAAIVSKWSSRVQFVTGTEVAAFDLRQPRRIYTFAPVFKTGQFATLSFNYRDYVARAANEAPSGSAGGTTYYLMLFNNEWVMISEGWWIT